MLATEDSDDSDVPVGELLARGRRNRQRLQNRPDAATMRSPSGAVVAGDSPAERQSIGDSRNKLIAGSVFPVMTWPLAMDQLKVGEKIVVPFFDKPYTPLPHGSERAPRANGSNCYKNLKERKWQYRRPLLTSGSKTGPEGSVLSDGAVAGGGVDSESEEGDIRTTDSSNIGVSEGGGGSGGGGGEGRRGGGSVGGGGEGRAVATAAGAVLGAGASSVAGTGAGAGGGVDSKWEGGESRTTDSSIIGVSEGGGGNGGGGGGGGHGAVAELASSAGLDQEQHEWLSSQYSQNDDASSSSSSSAAAASSSCSSCTTTLQQQKSKDAYRRRMSSINHAATAPPGALAQAQQQPNSAKAATLGSVLGTIKAPCGDGGGGGGGGERGAAATGAGAVSGAGASSVAGDGAGARGGVGDGDPVYSTIQCSVDPEMMAQSSKNSYDPEKDVYRITLGTPRVCFFGASGPPEVVWANLQASTVKMNSPFVEKIPALGSSSNAGECGSGVYSRNSNGDTFALTKLGHTELQKGKGWRMGVSIRYECSGVASRRSISLVSLRSGGDGWADPRPNCRHACGGNGVCTQTCPFALPTAGGLKRRVKPRAHHDCDFSVVETATLQHILENRIDLKLSGSHVPVGDVFRPPHPQQLDVQRVALESSLTLAARVGEAGKCSALAAANQEKTTTVSVGVEGRAKRRRSGAPVPLTVHVPERQTKASLVTWRSSWVQGDTADLSGSRLQSAGAAIDAVPSSLTHPAPSSLAHPAFVPKASQISQAARDRNMSREGDPIANAGDWHALEMFLREVALPKGNLLFYRRATPEGLPPLVVVSSEKSLAWCRWNNGKFGCADAKLDTNKERSPLSALVARTDRRTVYTLALWTSTHENFAITKTAVEAVLGAVPCLEEGCHCRATVSHGRDGSIRLTRACARLPNGTFRTLLGIGVDKHWPSINAYRVLGCKVSICDFHGVKAIDKQLYEKVGLTKEACFQLAIALKLLKRGRGASFARVVWLPAMVDLLEGWVVQKRFGIDIEAMREVLGYVESMWLNPIILEVWTDDAALVQIGYETTNNMIEGLWCHMDRVCFNGLHNTFVSTALQTVLGYDTRGNSNPQLGMFGFSEKQYEDAIESVPLTSSNKRRMMNAIAVFLTERRNTKEPLSSFSSSFSSSSSSSSSSSVSSSSVSSSVGVSRCQREDGLGERIMMKQHPLLPKLLFRTEQQVAIDRSLDHLVQLTCQSVLGPTEQHAITGYRCNLELKFCSCPDNLINGPFRKINCKHMELRSLRKEFDASQSKPETELKFVKKLAAYVKRFEASKPRGNRNEDAVQIDPNSISSGELLDILASCGGLSATKNTVEDSSVTGSDSDSGSDSTDDAAADATVQLYTVNFDSLITDLGLCPAIDDQGGIIVAGFQTLPSSGNVGPAAHQLIGVTLPFSIRCLHEIRTVNGVEVRGKAGLELLQAAVSNQSTVTSLGMAARIIRPGKADQNSKRRRKAKHGPKGRKIKNTEKSSQGRQVLSKKQKEVEARIKAKVVPSACAPSSNQVDIGTLLLALRKELGSAEWLKSLEKRFPITANTGFLK